MPRKSSQASSTGVIDRPDVTTLDLRAGAVVSPEVVNVFAEGVSAGAVEGLHLAPLGGRPSGAAIALSVQAWVRNLAYDKDLWVDLRLLGEDAVLHAETLPLSYQEGADGGGDFFTLGTAVPAPKPQPGGPTTRTLCYRLYGQMNGQIFTDGRALPKDPEPSWNGYSTGKWEGDTLVVETNGLRDGLWADYNGSPITSAAKITERFRRLNYGTLEIEVTVDDLKAYTKPWTVKLKQSIVLDADLLEYVCLENEKDLSHMVGK